MMIDRVSRCGSITGLTVLAFFPWSGPEGICAQEPVAWDSAGVTIVANAEAVRTGLPEWRVQIDPILVIGRMDGPEEYLLFNPLAAVVLEDGTTVIQDSSRGSFQIRFFDAEGTYLATASHWGEGPWEFHYANGLHPLPGDSILVTGVDGRFAVFGPRGERVREGRFKIDAGSLAEYAFLVDPSHLALEKNLGFPSTTPGIKRSEKSYRLYDFSNDHWTLVARLPNLIEFLETTPRGVASYPSPFSPRAHGAAGGGKVWIGQSDVPEIRGFGPEGDLSTIIRLQHAVERVTRSDAGRFRDLLLAGLTGGQQRLASSALRKMGSPDTVPFFGDLKVDRLGNLWVKRYEAPWAVGDQVWDVYDRGGAWVATAAVPEEILPGCVRHPVSPCDEILEIGKDYLLIDQKNALGVRSVVRYRLVKDLGGQTHPGSE